MQRLGEYVVYVDESGDHGLTQINPQFPVFVLAFCAFGVADYVSQVVPSVERLKFDFFGHDMVVLHEREIRKALPPFDKPGISLNRNWPVRTTGGRTATD